MVLANIGPDVDVGVLCGGTANVPIASLDELGTGVTQWSFTVTGDVSAFGPGPVQSPNPMGLGPGLGPLSNTFAVCQSNSPQVAFVEFNPPADALPGSTFVAMATVHAEDGSFADGVVKLRGEVKAPIVTVDKTSVDFGDVAPGVAVTSPLVLTSANGPVTFVPDSYSYPPFIITAPAGTSSAWNVFLQSSEPGDYSATVRWRGVPSAMYVPNFVPNAVSPCDSTTTITLHARILGDGGVGPDTADASDGGVD
jgi:hypothetical protein